MHFLDRVGASAALAVGQGSLGRTASAIVVQLGLDAKAQECELNLPKQLEGGGVEANVVRLLAVVRNCAIRREKTAQDRSHRGPVQLENRRREPFLGAALIQHGELFE